MTEKENSLSRDLGIELGNAASKRRDPLKTLENEVTELYERKQKQLAENVQKMKERFEQ